MDGGGNIYFNVIQVQVQVARLLHKFLSHTTQGCQLIKWLNTMTLFLAKPYHSCFRFLAQLQLLEKI